MSSQRLEDRVAFLEMEQRITVRGWRESMARANDLAERLAIAETRLAQIKRMAECDDLHPAANLGGLRIAIRCALGESNDVRFQNVAATGVAA